MAGLLAGLGKIAGGLAKTFLPKLAPKLIDAGKNLISKIPVVGKITNKLFGWGNNAATQTKPVQNQAVQQAPGIAQQVAAFQNQYKQGLSDAMNIFRGARDQFNSFRDEFRGGNGRPSFGQQMRQEWNDARAGFRAGLNEARGQFRNEVNQVRQQGRDMFNQGRAAFNEVRDMGRQMINDTRDMGRQMRQEWRSFN